VSGGCSASSSGCSGGEPFLAARGARVVAVSAAAHGLGGVYCLDNKIAQVAEPDPHTLDPQRHGTSRVPAPAGVSPHAADPDAATRLWTVSEHLTAASWAG
jgi:hypothetical protein